MDESHMNSRRVKRRAVGVLRGLDGIFISSIFKTFFYKNAGVME
jgi:hypothetical protein